MIRTILLALTLTGCVAPSQWMVGPDGSKVRCASSGWGYIGAPLAEHSFHVCVADYQKVGYKTMQED